MSEDKLLTVIIIIGIVAIIINHYLNEFGREENTIKSFILHLITMTLSLLLIFILITLWIMYVNNV